MKASNPREVYRMDSIVKDVLLELLIEKGASLLEGPAPKDERSVKFG